MRIRANLTNCGWRRLQAGMEGVDRERADAIILASSRGSRFYAKQARQEARTRARLADMRQQAAALTAADLVGAASLADRLFAEVEATRDLGRILVHLDMDMFFAAVEERDHPEYRGKPMAVGGMSMLSTANYAARKFGVRSAMPGYIARKLCPALILVEPRFEAYREASEKMVEVLRRYDPSPRVMSLDEAYLDVTDAVGKSIRLRACKTLRLLIYFSPSL